MTTETRQMLAQLGALHDDMAQLPAEIRNALNGKVKEVNAKKAELDAWKEGFEEAMRVARPASPNQLADTRKFDGFANGQKEVPVSFADGGFSGWGFSTYGQTTVNATVEVIPIKPSVLNARGLGVADTPLEAFLGGDRTSRGSDSFYGVRDHHVAIFDVEFLSIAGDGRDYGMFYWTLPAGSSNGWSKIPVFHQTKLFYNVIDWTGPDDRGDGKQAGFRFCGNRYVGVHIGKGDLGGGWTYGVGSRKHMGGANQGNFYGAPGCRMKIAIAFPYVGLGDHGDTPMWLDFGGDFTHFGLTDLIARWSPDT